MEMAMEAADELGLQVERLAAAAAGLEDVMERMRLMDVAAAGSREAELEEKLAAAEATIASLRASAVVAGSGRKTVATGVATLMAKAGVAAEATTAGALDASLVGLSIEQRIAVKAQMMRAGLIG